LKYLAKKVEGYYRWFDAEKKGIIALESILPLEDVVEGENTIVSEREFCESCRRVIVEFARNHPEIGTINLLDGIG
jgi:hypothetical protein